MFYLSVNADIQAHVEQVLNIKDKPTSMLSNIGWTEQESRHFLVSVLLIQVN